MKSMFRGLYLLEAFLAVDSLGATVSAFGVFTTLLGEKIVMTRLRALEVLAAAEKVGTFRFKSRGECLKVSFRT